MRYTQVWSGQRTRWAVAVGPESNEAEGRWTHSAALLKHFVDTEEKGVFLMDTDGVLSFANPAACALFKLDPDAVTGRTIETLVPNFWNNVSIRGLGPQSEDDTREGVLPCQGRDTNGRTFTVEVTATHDRERPDSQVLVVVRDASEQSVLLKQREQELAQFFAFFERSQEALFMHDASDQILNANEQAVILTGRSVDELRAGRMSDLHIDSDFAVRPDLELAPGTHVTFNTTWFHRDGHEIPVLCRVQKIRFFEDTVMLTLVQDVSRVQRLTDEMQRAQQLELVGRMAGSISHDFNNLLMVIINGLDALSEDLSLEGEEAEILDDVVLASEQAAVLAERLLGMARTSRSTRGVTNINELILELERPLKTMVGPEIEFKIDLVEDAPHVPLTAANVTQILTNLLMNARDATPAGGRVEVRTEVVESDLGLVVQLVVSDTGSGMTEEVQERIFEPLFTTKRHGAGTGLGLACVQAILESHEASIEVHSSPNRGSTFCVQFHVGEELDDDPSFAGPVVETLGARVLVVDDAPGVRRILCRLLRRRGYEVESAENGKEAIEVLNRFPRDHFDLVLTDILMPRLSGSDLVQYLLGFNDQIRVLVLSAYSGELGATDESPRVRYVSKPVQPVRLLSVIRRLMR